MQLADVLKAYKALPDAAREQVKREAMAATKHMRFVPLPGRQTEAYLSKADITCFGGRAGVGKSGLLVGLAQEHESSIIFRREAAQTDGLEKFGKEVYGADGFNGSDLEWSWPNGRSLKLAGLKEPDAWLKHAGRARDLMGFDEAGEFLAQQVVSLLGWLRGKPGRRCRMVFATNPPRSAEGAWLIEWFAPWLEVNHPLHAKPGELRWAFMDPVRMVPVWVDGADSRIDGRDDAPLSFTFIPAQLEDNPFNDTPEYRARLNALPEPLRSQLRDGIFALGGDDSEWQMIPTAWIRAAMDRWKPLPPDRVLMTALGADVAQGGGDDTVLAPRYDGWYDQLQKVPGAQTPGGTEVAGLVTAKRKNGAMVILDVGGGWGADAYGHLRGNGMDSAECVAYMGVKPSSAKSRDRLFHFTNLRSQLCWQFREALDPDQVGGSPIDLPPDNELLADLAAIEYEVVNRGREGQFIKAEPKEAVVKKLGRSPNKGDAVVMSWYAGAKVLSRTRVSSREHGDYGGRGRSIPVDLGPRRRAM
jgi:terminase large subunit-like protein